MSGPIVGGSPWTRNAVAAMDPFARSITEGRIPDGHRIVVAASRKPGDWTLVLRNEQGEVARRATRSLEIGCELLLEEALRA